MPQQLVDVLYYASNSEVISDSQLAADSYGHEEPVEEDCKIDNILDMVFEDDEDLD